MFKSNPKPKPPKRTWAVQVLTRDYVVEGVLQPRIDDTTQYFADLTRLLKQGTNGGIDLTLVSARVQPTGNLAAAPRAFAEWTMRLDSNVAALMPADEDGANTLRQEYSHFKYPFPSALYVGAYQVQGTLLVDNPLGWQDLRGFVPVADAQIDCLAPGARLSAWRLPWLLLNGALVQGDARGPQ